MCPQICGDWGSSKRRRLAVSDLTLMPTNQRVRDLDTLISASRCVHKFVVIGAAENVAGSQCRVWLDFDAD